MQNQANYKANIFYHSGDKKNRNFTWSSLVKENIEIEGYELQKLLKQQLLEQIDIFYNQKESCLLECEIIVEVDNIFLDQK